MQMFRRIAGALSALVTIALTAGSAQGQTLQGQPSTGLHLEQKRPEVTANRGPRFLFTRLQCALDPQNGYSYYLTNKNAYAVPVGTTVTIWARTTKEAKPVKSNWPLDYPIVAGDHLRVGNYNPSLGLTMCTATTPYVGPR